MAALYTEDGSAGEDLIWGSEVKIEIDFGETSKRSSVHEARAEADDEGSIRISSPLSSFNSSSCVDVRGRPRSRTKQLRRRGIDLSRDELRISSRWSNSERESMELFREAIREKARDREKNEKLLLRWMPQDRTKTQMIKDVWNIKEKLAKTLQGSVSRGRRSNREAPNQTPDLAAQPPADKVAPEPRIPDPVRAEPQLSIQQVQMSNPTPSSVSSLQLEGQETLSHELHSYAADDRRQHVTRQMSWQQHLRHDLQPYSVQALRRKKANCGLREDLKARWISNRRDAQHATLPSENFLGYTQNRAIRKSSSARPLLVQSSSDMSQISQRDVESYWRLPSVPDPAVWPPTRSFSRVSSPLVDQPQHLNEAPISQSFQSARWRTSGGTQGRSPSSSLLVTSLESRTASISDNQSSDLDHQPPSTELVAALKGRLAKVSDEDTLFTMRPLLQTSTSTVYGRAIRESQNTPPSTKGDYSETSNSTDHHAMSPHSHHHDLPVRSKVVSQGFASSMSLPEMPCWDEANLDTGLQHGSPCEHFRRHFY
ncbi:hypothetical protein LTS08_005985 [Lithohypha guttulata]|uniref:uncharacterized protein n=1 Tax=Lithohypha guttulata TaxID=1690604 RepID=UPI002DDE9389|nr:hypothetical protein LTR51_002499 [Lithohypha guttulata]KAK5099403.1 hypothetical protein LTS08_005985 [Lithohypha guttulata]